MQGHEERRTVERRLSIDDHRMRTPNLEAVYTEFPSPAAMGIRPDLDAHTRRVWELAAHGMFLHRPPLGGRKWCYVFESWERADFEAVLAIRAVVAEMEPGWVAAVADARRFSDDPRAVCAWSELHPYAVLALL
jgi:hypothetical protein